MSKSVTVRLDDHRNDFVDALAPLLGCTKSDVVRVALDALENKLPTGVVEAVVRPSLSEGDKRLLSSARLAVDRVGVNVNQLARVAHRQGAVDDDLIVEWRRALMQLHRVIDEIEKEETK